MGAAGVISVAYAIQLERASAADQMAAMSGKETDYRGDLDESLGITDRWIGDNNTDAAGQVAEAEDLTQQNVTQLIDFISTVNRMM